MIALSAPVLVLDLEPYVEVIANDLMSQALFFLDVLSGH